MTAQQRQQVFGRYGLAEDQGVYQLDHFISLELGGANTVENLWPEPYEPRPGAHEKDRVENYLHRRVCSGSMTLQQAQDAMRSDWVAVYREMS